MKRRLFTSTLLTSGFLAAGSLLNSKSVQAASIESSAPTLTVFRSPTCGCCEDWVSHVQSAGFTVEDHITADMDAIKARYGIPEPLASCHTALIATGNETGHEHRYWVEGHVPATDIQRLIAEQSVSIAGIATPGMPIGSPGMEQGSEVEPYQVIAATTAGKFSVFASHG